MRHLIRLCKVSMDYNIVNPLSKPLSGAEHKATHLAKGLRQVVGDCLWDVLRFVHTLCNKVFTWDIWHPIISIKGRIFPFSFVCGLKSNEMFK